MPIWLRGARAEHHGMDIVLIVVAIWIALDIALVWAIAAMSARGSGAPAVERSRRGAGSRRAAAALSLPRIGETSVPVTDR
ncbi:hypothetical protein [Patulibacter minatonensis]|uniref:hypothetical protein n=1 Tax=Patulibacter minatonensis TaxID=298163 RepID=UPI00047E33DD|nr:hypothetical protein [Patulibacter minatonensis]